MEKETCEKFGCGATLFVGSRGLFGQVRHTCVEKFFKKPGTRGKN